jgi:hypothetical protein
VLVREKVDERYRFNSCQCCDGQVFYHSFFWGDHLTQANGTPNAAVSLHRFLYQVKTSVLGDAVS